MNKNGTVSPKINAELVMGYGISTYHHFQSELNEYGWHKFKNIEGFSTADMQEEEKEVGNVLKLVDEDRYMEIPWADYALYNIA